MTRHIRSLSQRARLAEFIFSESGAMNAKKAAQMGAVLGASALAGVLMSAGTAEAGCIACPPGDHQWCVDNTVFNHCLPINCGGCGDFCTNGFANC